MLQQNMYNFRKKEKHYFRLRINLQGLKIKCKIKVNMYQSYFLIQYIL